MSIDYLVFANLMLLSRWVYLFHDQRLPSRLTLGVLAIQLLALGLFYRPGEALSGALTLVALINAIGWWLERHVDPPRGYRLLTLVMLLLVPGLLNGVTGGLQVRTAVFALFNGLNGWLPLFNMQVWHQSITPHLLLFGALLLANEANILIRWIFHLCRLYPRDANRDSGIDERAFNAGRIIGFVERWLMFIVVLHSEDLSALAFIIAAKGLARMKQLEDRDFAEYMLIGTLLSALAALLVGLWIKPWLSG